MTTAAQPISDPRVASSRPLHPFLWSVRRELMEHRSITLGPLIVTGLFLIGFCISLIHLPTRVRALASLTPNLQVGDLAQPFDVATGFIIAIFYSLEALYSERRDRSILFWKSMPVSDATTVLSKAVIPTFILPLITYLLTILTQWIMLLLSSAVLAANGLPVARLWSAVPFVGNSLMLLYHLILIHGLWYAPMWAFLLFVSVLAPRTPVLYAALPIAAIAGIEQVVFKTTRFLNLLSDRINGAGSDIPFTMGNDMGVSGTAASAHLNFLHFLVNPGLWIGLLLAAAFLYAAIQIRHRRSPI